MNDEEKIKNLLTQIQEKAKFDDRNNKNGVSFMTFHLKLLEDLINDYFKRNNK